MGRTLLVLAQSAMLAACASFFSHGGDARVPLAYTATQVIDTVPGPFVNRIYVSGERERQDAALGGMTVTTILRRDLGVAWLLVPGLQQYEEIALGDVPTASLHATFAGLQRTCRGQATLHGITTDHCTYADAADRPVAVAWISAEGIVIRGNVFADEAAGKPAAVITLHDVCIGPLCIGASEQLLFDLPAGYARRAGGGQVPAVSSP